MEYEKGMVIASAVDQTKSTFFRFGPFQKFLVLVICWGISSGSYMIMPLAYFELMPKFKCQYADSIHKEKFWQEC